MEKKTVLVVDDRPNWRRTARDLLTPHGFVVEEASNFDVAISKLRSSRPPFHVLIADIRLEEGDPRNIRGLDVVDYAMKLGGCTNAIVWTAFPTINTAKRAFKDLKVFDYIVKDPQDEDGQPRDFDVDNFVEVVRKAADAAKQKRWENRILLVDDDERWGNRISELVAQAGYSLERIETYSKALAGIRKSEVRLVLVEIAIQQEQVNKGLDFIRLVRKTRPQAQVIVISDAGTKATVRDAFAELGVVDFMQKESNGGFEPERLLANVRQVYTAVHELFLIAEVEHLLVEEQPRVEEECVLVLSGHRNVLRSDRAVAIWLPPSKSMIEIEVAVYVGPEAEISPTSNQIWSIPTSGEVRDLHFGLTPKCPGPLTIDIEFFGEAGWWKRLEHTLHVLPASIEVV